MSKKEFLSILQNELMDLPKNEREEIVCDFEEHFTMGLKSGKSEYEISEELGDPKKLAKSYKVSVYIDEAKNNPNVNNIFKAVFATMAIGFFNLVFVLGPFIGILGVILGLFATSIGVFIGGIALIFAPLFNSFAHISIFSANLLVCIFWGISMSCLGALLTIFTIYISKWVCRGTMKYLKWNVDIVKR